MSFDDPTRVFAPAALDIAPIVPAAPQRRACPVGDIELNYLVWGDTSRPPVVLVHGGKDHGRMWDWTVAALIGEWCVIVPDLRGHGDSGRAPGGGYAGEQFVADFAAFMAHLGNEGFAGPMPLIGHSLGGNLVLTHAALYPEQVSRVIALEGLGAAPVQYHHYMERPPAERYRRWVSARLALQAKGTRRFTDPEEMVDRLARVHKNLSPEQARHLALHAIRAMPASDGGGYAWKHDPLAGIWPTPRMTSPEE